MIHASQPFTLDNAGIGKLVHRPGESLRGGVDEHDRLVREVNAKGDTVWEFSQADLPPDIVFHNIQTADRLANGNTVIFSSTGGTKPADRPGIIQLVEVTPDKRVVWLLQDWKHLGPATTAQFLDEPGIPERPGDVQH